MRGADDVASLSPMSTRISPSRRLGSTLRRFSALSVLSIPALGIFVTVGALGLAGCTGDPGPIVTETPSATATSSLTPSPSASPSVSAAPLTDAELLALMPPDAALPDVRGAIETAIFFVEQFSVTYETGDLRIWDALSMPGCIFCASVRDGVIAEHAAGDHEIGGELTVDRSSIVANYYDVDGYWYVTFRYSQTESTTVHDDGSTSLNGDGGTGSTSMRMTTLEGVWRVSGVEVVAD